MGEDSQNVPGAEGAGGDFIVGPALTQEELLRRKSVMYDDGTLLGDARDDAAVEQRQADLEEHLKEGRSVLASIWDWVTTALIGDNSPYRNMMDPNSKFHYCFEAATPEEKQTLTQANETATAAEHAVDVSAHAAPDGKPAADTVVDARIAKTDAALAGAAIVQNHGTPADAAEASTNAQTLREKREYDRETQRLIRLAHTKDEKLAILKQRSPDLAAEVERKAAQELQHRADGGSAAAPAPPIATLPTNPVSVIAAPVASPGPAATSTTVAPALPPSLPAKTGAEAPLSPTTQFNTAGENSKTPASPALALAQDAGAFYDANRQLLDISVNDNLDDPDSKYNSSLWYALDKKKELVDAYDNTVDKEQAADDVSDKTINADNFLAYRQASLDRKLAVNDIVAFDYSGHNRTDELAQAQADRAKILDEQKKLADLKTQMEGKSEDEKKEILKAAFPPDKKAGQTLGDFDRYLAGVPEEPAKPEPGKEAAPEPDEPDEGNYLNDWVLSGDWYDCGSACSIYDLPGGIAPACTIQPAFTAVASAQPLSTDPKAEATPGSTATAAIKPPTALA